MGQALRPLRARLSARRGTAIALAAALVMSLVAGVRSPAQAAALCGTPGRDGSATITGVVNTYFTGTATANATNTSLTLGAHATGDANVAIASGDLLLVIQMQGATINTSNASSYGDGSTGSGATSTTAGVYEYVVANGALATTGGTLSITGTNGGGLINTYATGAGARFEVIRVPQYLSPTVGAALTALAWNGTAGGVLAIDVQNTLGGGGGTVVADAKGFRGGQGRALAGDATTANGDWVNVDTKNAHGIKGEGTAGTPGLVYAGGTGTTVTDTYPSGGDTGRGAPGNAGGGGADAHVASNDQNTGGGGGGNGGGGGVGGKSWSSNAAYGGLGGTFVPSATQVVLGGGGGAGSRNNGAGYDSSGGTGGGIVMMRVGGVSSTVTISASGGMGVEPQNDGGGGGGAGGSVVVTGLASLNGITVTADGANGTNADLINAGAAAHGPGGGGGGGVVVQSGGASATLAGGAAGTTDGSPTPDAHYGAAAGGSGQDLSIPYNGIPGASSGAECGSSTGTVSIGPVGVPAATGSYDGNVATTDENDFVEKSFAPAGFSAINSSTTAGVPNGNTYTSAVTGIAVRHEVNNSGTKSRTFVYLAQAPSSPAGWTVAVYNDNGGALGTQIAGTASANAYQTTAAVTIASGGTAYVWTVYSAPSGVQAFSRFDAWIQVAQSNAVTNNNTVHDELYSGFIVQTKSYVVTAHNCASPPAAAGGWCPGGTLKYTVDIRNIAVPANGTTPANATLTASTLLLTDDGTNANSWAKDGGYMNTPGVTATGTAPGTITYFYNAASGTAFPANYATTNLVTKFTAAWPALAASVNSQVSFSVIQF